MSGPGRTRGIAGLWAVGGLLVVCAGCPPVPDDALEPNDTPETATVLMAGVPVDANAVQDSPDVFAFSAGPGQTIVFTLEDRGEDDCAAFTVTAPDGSALYQDTNRFCGRDFSTPITAPGASLQSPPGGGYTLRIPAAMQGRYLLTVDERGQADNVIDFRWLYRLTATIETN